MLGLRQDLSLLAKKEGGKSGCPEKLRGRVVILGQRAWAVGASRLASPRLGQLIILPRGPRCSRIFANGAVSRKEGRRVWWIVTTDQGAPIIRGMSSTLQAGGALVLTLDSVMSSTTGLPLSAGSATPTVGRR